MQLSKKKNLASRTLKVGKNRIEFSKGREDEIKEAITKQDILDLHKEGAIKIKDVRGRKKVKKRKYRRGAGKIKKRLNKRKQDYVKLTRKLRVFARHFLKTKTISKEGYFKIRKMIKAGKFGSKRHLNESLEEIR